MPAAVSAMLGLEKAVPGSDGDSAGIGSFLEIGVESPGIRIEDWD
jgi:hypothetical protein